MPVAAVEIEVSLQAYESQAREGKHLAPFSLTPSESLFLVSVTATCAELGIALVAYSYGFLSSSSSPLSDPQQPSRSWITHRSD
jgi:hypothetical protein